MQHTPVRDSLPRSSASALTRAFSARKPGQARPAIAVYESAGTRGRRCARELREAFKQSEAAVGRREAEASTAAETVASLRKENAALNTQVGSRQAGAC